MNRITKFKTKEKALENKKKGDKLFYDHFIDEYFIVSPIKKIWKEGEFEENFIMAPETFEECLKLKIENCQDCEYVSDKYGRMCPKRTKLLNRAKMEVF